ncbi:MAG: FKBP-type peptidyl-prolyl cis-trans isomerase [Marinomonas sp.]
MTEVTRVPIQPVAKGSLTKLWIGVIIALLIGAGVAWAAMPKGVSLDTITAGTGPNPTDSDVIFVKYKGMLADTGEVFDESQDAPLPVQGIFPEGNPLPLAQMVPGFREGALQMQKGGKYELFIPSDKAYGSNPPEGAPIPADADLKFEVEMIDFMSEDDFQRRIGMLQKMMEDQNGGAGAGGAAGGPPQGAPAGPPPR